MTLQEYLDMLAISAHWLMAMLDSPAECHRRYLDGPAQEPNDAMRFGTLVHCLALTPQNLEREFIIADYERRSAAGKIRYAELTAIGLSVIKPAELEKAKAIVAALEADSEARQLLRSGKKEHVIVQPRLGEQLPLKARLDVHHETSHRVVELKTTRDLDTINAAMEHYHYPLQAAFYADLAHTQTVIFIFVQTREPFQVAVIPMTHAQLQAGREQWQSALRQFDDCWQRNEWPEAPAVALDDDPLMMDLTPHGSSAPVELEL